MKKSHLLLFIAGLALGIFSARLMPSKAMAKSAGDDSAVPVQLEAFRAYLQETRQTNVLQRFDSYGNVILCLKDYTSLAFAIAALPLLREGQTNMVFKLLEGHLNSDLLSLAEAHRALPVELQKGTDLGIVRRIKAYREKYPFEENDPQVERGVQGTLRYMEEQAAK